MANELPIENQTINYFVLINLPTGENAEIKPYKVGDYRFDPGLKEKDRVEIEFEVQECYPYHMLEQPPRRCDAKKFLLSAEVSKLVKHLGKYRVQVAIYLEPIDLSPEIAGRTRTLNEYEYQRYSDLPL